MQTYVGESVEESDLVLTCEEDLLISKDSDATTFKEVLSLHLVCVDYL